MSVRRILHGLKGDNNGAALAEFSLLFPVLAALLFGILEMSTVFWQITQAEWATKRALRVATTRSLVPAGAIEDCGVVTTAFAGTPCSSVAGSDSWTVICTGDAPAPCDVTAMTEVVAEITRVYPQATASNVQVRLDGAGLGFVGMGKPVPIVSVRLTGMTFDFIVLDSLLGLALTMPIANSSGPGEDLTGVGI